MPKAATDVIEEVFAQAQADERTERLAEALHRLWKDDRWNVDEIDRAVQAEAEAQ